MAASPIRISDEDLEDARLVVRFALAIATRDAKEAGPAFLPRGARKRAWAKKLDRLYTVLVFGPHVGTWHDAHGEILPGEHAYVSVKDQQTLRTVTEDMIAMHSVTQEVDGAEEVLTTGLGEAAIRVRDHLHQFP